MTARITDWAGGPPSLPQTRCQAPGRRSLTPRAGPAVAVSGLSFTPTSVLESLQLSQSQRQTQMDAVKGEMAPFVPHIKLTKIKHVY